MSNVTWKHDPSDDSHIAYAGSKPVAVVQKEPDGLWSYRLHMLTVDEPGAATGLPSADIAKQQAVEAVERWFKGTGYVPRDDDVVPLIYGWINYCPRTNSCQPWLYETKEKALKSMTPGSRPVYVLSGPPPKPEGTP